MRPAPRERPARNSPSEREPFCIGLFNRGNRLAGHPGESLTRSSANSGRSLAPRRNFRLWQDQEAIAPGKDWEAEITRAVEQSVFFIPIVTPRAVGSDYCKFEFASFVAREGALGRGDLVFPIL